MKLPNEASSELNLCLSTRCNFCRDVCPEYNANRTEFNSPRGKLELISEVLKGRIDPIEVVNVLPECDTCRKCYFSCPGGVDVPKIFQEFKVLFGDKK